jgi:hypothetical protein
MVVALPRRPFLLVESLLLMGIASGGASRGSAYVDAIDAILDPWAVPHLAPGSRAILDHH